MDQKIANFLLAHRHGLATLLYLAQLPRKDARFIGRQKDLYTSRRIEQICLFVLRAIEHETLTEQIQKQRQAEELASFVRRYNATAKKAAEADKIINSATAFDDFKQWQKAQSKSNKSLNEMLFDDFGAHQADLAGWLSDNQAALADAQSWLAKRKSELERPEPGLRRIKPPQSRAEFSDGLKTAALDSADFLPGLLATAGGLLINGIPEDGGKISAEELALVAEMKTTWGLE